MDVNSYGPNSFKSKETKNTQLNKSNKKVVTGKVINKPSRRFFKEFFSKDLNEIKEYLIYDVLMPKTKDVLFDLIDNGTSMLIYGDGRGSKKKPQSGAYISYNNYSSNNSASKSATIPHTRRSDIVQDIIFDNPQDAENVLEGLINIVDVYGMCSVADLYELTGLDTTSTDNNYGWSNLGSAKTKRIREGYILDLPEPKVL